MDPIANVQEQLLIAARILATTNKTSEQITRLISPIIEDAEYLAELVIAQNEWRARGGFDPYGDTADLHGRIVEALRDGHRNDSAADQVAFVSDVVGWSAQNDPYCQHSASMTHTSPPVPAPHGAPPGPPLRPHDH